MFLSPPLLLPFCRLSLSLFLFCSLSLSLSLHSLSLYHSACLSLSLRVSLSLYFLILFLSLFLHLLLSLPPSHLSLFPRSGTIIPVRRDSRFIFLRLASHRHPDHIFPLGLASFAVVNHHSTCLYIPSDTRFIHYNKSSTEKNTAQQLRYVDLSREYS